MTVSVARPDAANLVLRTFGRPLHPDLLCHHESTSLSLPGMSLDLRLIAAGHALIVKTDVQTLTELISAGDEPHPIRGRLLEQKLKGCRTESVQFESGLRYDVSCTLERMSLAVFLRQNEELMADGPSASLFAEFPGKNRFSPGPLSLVRLEVCRHSIVVHAFHTFPDQLTVVKTQSLVEYEA